VGVVAIDTDLRVLLWNERAEDLWGLQAKEVEGRSLMDLDIGLPVEELEGPIKDLVAGDDSGQFTLEAVNRRGRSIKCVVRRTLRLDPDGDIQGVVLLMEEVRV
jgi:two-component system CheB/CheR fusion protein